MIDTLRGSSEGEVEGGVLSENKSYSESLMGRSRNLLLAIIAATGATACVPYVYVQPSRGYYPERSNYYYDNGYRSYSSPTHEITGFPLRIKRIDNGNNRGGHHNHQGGNHRGNHRR